MATPSSSLKSEKMRNRRSSITFVVLSLLLLAAFVNSAEAQTVPSSDIDLLEFPLNLEYLEAEFFLHGALGDGLDKYAPNLTGGGPKPVGAKKASLDPLTRDVIEQFAWQEVGHLRAIKRMVKGFPRPQLDLRPMTFAKIIDNAFGRKLVPPFNPYASSLNYLISCYIVPYVGLTGYVGANPKLNGTASKRLVAGLLAVESGQDAVLRGALYQMRNVRVKPWGITVAEFTDRLSLMRNKLGRDGMKDEGLEVERRWSPEGKSTGNILAGDDNSVAFARTPEEILRIVYGSGDEGAPGGFYPKGADGRLAASYLHRRA